jgi:ElaB/YqjD/DUF883 family membrane-anchored ribosome-binding protein
MAANKDDIEKEVKEKAEELKNSAEELKDEGLDGYESLIDRLDSERQSIGRELDRDYQEARRYVRSNPEEGVLFGLIGGLALGFLLGRLNK